MGGKLSSCKEESKTTEDGSLPLEHFRQILASGASHVLMHFIYLFTSNWCRPVTSGIWERANFNN